MSDLPPTHKRNKSAVSRALQRISSRTDGDAGSDRNEMDNTAAAGNNNLLQPTASSRSSLQTTRPHLSTTMSNTSLLSAVPVIPSTSMSGTQGATIEQSVRLFKIFEALRSGDTLAIAKATKPDDDTKNGGTTVLHLAVQCAEMSVIEYVLSQQPAAVNLKDRDGNTPLHIAATLGRGPAVKLLLAQPDVNDAILNHHGKTPLDLARNPDVFQQLQLARSVYIDSTVRSIQSLVIQGDFDNLETILSDARFKTTVDVNGPELVTDPFILEAGGSLLHEAARKKDLKLAQILLLNGADPFRRDRKGKLPQDITRDERTRTILKKSPAAQAAQRSIQEKTILGEASQSGFLLSEEVGPGGKESREMKGYLRKWTNYTSGYKLRWFVLEDGVLSYYKHQDDAGSACRGAINMRIAKLHMDPKDKLLFEILGKSSVKYNLKANHQIEAKRWFWALNNAIQWAKDEARDDMKRPDQGPSASRDARSEHLERQRTRDGENIPAAPTKSMLVPGTAFDQGIASTGTSTPLAGSILGDRLSSYAPSVPEDSSVRLSRTDTAFIEADIDAEEEFADDASSHELRPANKDAFSITAQSAKLQLELLEQVSVGLQSERDKNPGLMISHPTVLQALSSYETAVGNLKGLLMDLLRISRDHEAYWQYRLDREQDIRRLWEDSMAKVAREQEELELRIGESEDKRRRTKRALKEALETTLTDPAEGETSQDLMATEQADSTFSTRDELSKERGRRATIVDLLNHEMSDDGHSDEEFFDAVDAGEVEVVEVLPATSPPAYVGEAIFAEKIEEVKDDREGRAVEVAKSYRGHEGKLREKLKIDADDRPKVSLWSILKSMIGKDMTKMTLPVTFNEPTSLLYRVVEDMEYADLLNVAAERMDSTERLVYVAAFAASEYASTIGRVAKPFNPLLGETYEYVRPDVGYRFLIEQVSHHPPVGAAHAESAKWDYYGESAMKSKFYGKSFEFNPLGTWFLQLRPTSGGTELYTWKKVTSCVVGIITGNPTVDNYGLMEIKNWTTGEVCYLDFKPKGWKASSAYQVTGRVVDSAGKTRWSVGGRWNDKIYARLTPGYEGEVGPSTVTGDKHGKDQAFLVWEAHERPANIPFNITPFVVTLNNLPDELRLIVPPTDSRLRPDQRAMEEAEYDVAAVEKNRVEEGQRMRRRVREAKGEEFEPRWFSKAKHPITGEDYYQFSGDYWKIREDVAQGKSSWSEHKLEPIF